MMPLKTAAMEKLNWNTSTAPILFSHTIKSTKTLSRGTTIRLKFLLTTIMIGNPASTIANTSPSNPTPKTTAVFFH